MILKWIGHASVSVAYGWNLALVCKLSVHALLLFWTELLSTGVLETDTLAPLSMALVGAWRER